MDIQWILTNPIRLAYYPFEHSHPTISLLFYLMEVVLYISVQQRSYT